MANAVQSACRVLALLTALAGACSPARQVADQTQEAKTPGAVWRERVRALREREGALRSSFSPRQQPAWLDVSGADPYRIVAAPEDPGRLVRGDDTLVGLLRGAKAFVTLDGDLHELRRVQLKETPTALCVARSPRAAWVASRYGTHLVHIALGSDGAASIDAEHELPAPIADLACGDKGLLYALPVDGSELLTLDASARVIGRAPALPGGLRLQKQGRFLLESSVFERALRVRELDQAGMPGRELGRIQHDGTLWAFNTVEESANAGKPSSLLIAVAGVEDKPLVRAHGEFENIDSFVWLYRLGAHGIERLAEVDVSDFGVVVPKALLFSFGADVMKLQVFAAGSGKMLELGWGNDLSAEPRSETHPIPPGVTDAISARDGGIVYASPLFDAWVKLPFQQAPRIVRVDPERRAEPDVRLGEALFFTDLMAPDNTSRGTHSRFSCETCHFEGGVDGRTHYTGRDDVSVVTKPLFGLANNRPHFSRAMDPDLSSVCHNEFRVAGAGSGADPWFTLETSRFAWLHELGIDRAEVSPLELRAALLRFLYAFSHAPNALSQGREHFSELEAAGARAFREHCEGCHAARLLSDDASSTAPFEAWEQLIFCRNAPLVWARGEYAKTGILPYVHAQGTRITSLRRLALKPRYFTNGSASDLASVLARFREAPEGAEHEAPGDAHLPALPEKTRVALLAFLRLL
jgi:hypothetical protein